MLPLAAQEFRLSGMVVQYDGSPAQKARVVLSPKEGTRQSTTTNPLGKFEFSGLQAGSHRITILFKDHKLLSTSVEMPATDYTLETIQLVSTIYELDEVTIEGQAPPAQMKGDTVEMNSSAFKANPDADAQDLLEKMPGIVVQDGQVQAQGEQVQQVLVDGRRFFGDDPNAALKNLPADVIQKIQVFDQQSEQAQQTGFDDGQTVKTINIVTKPEMRNGTFGKGYVGGGTFGDSLAGDLPYQAGGNINFFQDARRISIVALSNNINRQNFSSEDLLGVASASSGRGRRGGFGGRGGGRGGRGGGGFSGGRGGRGGSNVGDFLVGEQGGISTTQAVGINYTDNWGKKVEVSGSYFFNLSDNVADQRTLQDYFSDSDVSQTYSETERSDTRNVNHRMNLRLNYKISDRTSLIWRPRISIQQNEGHSVIAAESRLGKNLLNESDNEFNADLVGINASNQLFFRHRFEKRGRSFSIRLQTDYSRNSGENYLNSILNYYTDPISLDTIDQTSSLQSDGWKVSTGLMYTEPVGKGMLQLNYTFSPEINNSDQETYNYDWQTRGYTQLDTLLSNTFNNTYNAHQIGGGYMFRGNNNKTFFISRINVQKSTLNNDQVFPYPSNNKFVFYNILPFVMLRHRFENRADLRVIYRASTNPPSITQLQEVVDNSNPLQLSTGNPDLQQNFQNFFMARYNSTNTEKGRMTMFFVSGQYTDNYIANSVVQAQEGTWMDVGGGKVFLEQGAQLTRPVNLDGYWNVRSLVTLGKLVNAIKTNVNLNLSADYSRRPGMTNEIVNFTNTATLGVGLVLSSNISQKVDFTISSRSNFSQATNSFDAQQNVDYLNQVSKVKVNFIFGPGIVLRSELNHQLYRGLTDSFNQDFWLWSGGVAKKFGKNQRAELQLSVFDLLKQNTNIQRTVNELYIQDLQSIVLQRYLMLTFTYNLRNFTETNANTGRGPSNR